jgi:hypothetical protein
MGDHRMRLAVVSLASLTLAGCGADEPRDPAGDLLAQAGGSTCSGSTSDPAAAASISAFMDTLPYGAPESPLRDAIIDAIIRACHQFAPAASGPGWKTEYCHAHLASAINKESTYDPELVVTDDYATRSVDGERASDPTVGLLQIRYSSTVHDYVANAPLETLACIGCRVPPSVEAHAGEPGDSPYWAVTGPSANMSLMQSVACNVGLGAYYYYMNATGNGAQAKPTYADGYCRGQGASGNLVTGLLSHLEGPSRGRGVLADMAAVEAGKESRPGAHEYVTTIKGWFDAMIPEPGNTHPFFIPLEPAPGRFCR